MSILLQKKLSHSAIQSRIHKFFNTKVTPWILLDEAADEL